MAETGDWVTPRLYGKPWFEKPPLFYWGAALSFKLFGISEAAARLPSAISALLATLALAWLALRLYGAEAARWLLLLLPTTVGMIGFSHAAATDMPFSGMLTIAMVCAAVVLGLARNEHTPILPRTPWLALLLFGFFLGLAVLAKGPAAIILSGGAIFFWALFTKRWRDALRLLHPIALASFCLTALPWYILCARRNPDFFRIFIIEHNFKRYLTSEFQHTQPLWYYGGIVAVGLVPWTFQLVVKFLLPDRALGKQPTRDPKSFFFWTWILFTVVFFTLSWSKLPGYILPAIPPLVLLLLPSTKSAPHSERDRRLENLGFTLTAAAFCIWPIAHSFYVSWINRQIPQTLSAVRIPPDFIFLLRLIGCIGLLMVGICGFRKRFDALLIVTAILTVVLLDGTERTLLPWEEKIISTRQFAQTIVQSTRPNLGVYSFKLDRSLQYGLEYYLHKPLVEWNPNLPTPGYILYSEKASNELRWGEVGLVSIQMEGFPGTGICLKQETLSDAPPDGGQPH